MDRWRIRLRCLRGRRPVRGRCSGRGYVLLTLAVAVGLSLTAIRSVRARLRPMLEAAAQVQIHDQVTSAIQDAVLTDLEARSVTYGDLVTLQKDDSGGIAAITAQAAAMGRLQTELGRTVLTAVQGVRTSSLAVPVGSLLDSDLLWAKGPAVQVRALWVGTVETSFDSQFVSAGINQTCHRIWLNVHVPIKVLLPGGPLETTVETRILAAETVIVGQVPDTVLNWERN